MLPRSRVAPANAPPPVVTPDFDAKTWQLASDGRDSAVMARTSSPEFPLFAVAVAPVDACWVSLGAAGVDDSAGLADLLGVDVVFASVLVGAEAGGDPETSFPDSPGCGEP